MKALRAALHDSTRLPRHPYKETKRRSDAGDNIRGVLQELYLRNGVTSPGDRTGRLDITAGIELLENSILYELDAR